MKILDSNEYINEKLAISPVTKTMLDDYRKDVPVNNAVRKFIKDNQLKWNPKTMKYDCDGEVRVTDDIVSNGKLIINFGKVNGDFVYGYYGITSLDGAPEYVGGDFYCHNNLLTSLKNAPKKVDGSFRCENNKLTTLDGAPQEIGGGFACHNNRLDSLEYAPQKVNDYFYCDNNEINTLDGAPKEVGGDFSCNQNYITTLESDIKYVGGDFFCKGNPSLVLPEEKPSWIKGEIYD